MISSKLISRSNRSSIWKSAAFSRSLPYSSLPASLSKINSKVLDNKTLKKITDPEVYVSFARCRETGEAMDKPLKNALADSIQKWAQNNGADTYSHWFSPVRGMVHGEKIETFLDVDFKTTELGTGLSGTELFQTETDGSSFPNGGLRVTHSAAAFMGWDLWSPPFIYENVLYIPSTFVSWTGEALDEKTPLMRSNAAVSREGLRLLRHLDVADPAQRVLCNVGWEQEFFVLDAELMDMRQDLQACQRTLFGQVPLKGQEDSDHYFKKMPTRVREFLVEARERMWQMGISIDCLHSEVAPGQFELSPVFSLTNLAADTNILATEILIDTAKERGLAVLFHEKPFAGINGSGKHNNWGLNTDTGANLFVAGETAAEQRRFVAMVAALMRAIKLHGDLLRLGVSTAGNDHRLGAQEAPPPIITLYLGESLEAHIKAAAAGGPFDGYLTDDKLIQGTSTSHEIKANAEDRNRTAPFPYCTNRFEFRAVGSNQHIGFPLTLLNTAMAEGLRYMADLMDSGQAVDDVIRQTVQENMGCLFTGNGYDTELLTKFAQDNSLFHIKSTPEAYDEMTSDKNLQLFEDLRVFNRHEATARQQILLDEFTSTLTREARTALHMLQTQFVPAATRDVAQDQATGFSHTVLDQKKQTTEQLLEATAQLQKALETVPDDSRAAATYLHEQVRPLMDQARAHVDQLESMISNYPVPTYSDLVWSSAK